MAKHRRRIPRYRREADDRVKAAGLSEKEIAALSKFLPRANDINVYDTLDERCAVDHFLGKSLADAEARFKENESHYLDDFMWMGPKAFCFYVTAAIKHIKGESAGANAVSHFSMILGFRLGDPDGRKEISPILPALREAVRYVVEHWEEYEVDPEIYGDLRGEYARWLVELSD